MKSTVHITNHKAFENYQVHNIILNGFCTALLNYTIWVFYKKINRISIDKGLLLTHTEWNRASFKLLVFNSEWGIDLWQTAQIMQFHLLWSVEHPVFAIKHFLETMIL